MNRIGKLVSATAGLLLLAGSALASGPTPNSAIFELRVFNDCPTSTVGTTDSYPASLSISDSNLSCGGFANLHVWRLSEDDAAQILFPNNSAFSIEFDMVVDGTAQGEAGLQIAPWWSQADGRINCRTTDGEIAVFGGRLPFYSFTGNHGLHYVKGTSIHLKATYLANGLSMADPATVEYEVTYGGNTYSSGPLAFDEGNPAEDPPYGLWGMLNDAKVGGFVQPFLQPGNPAADLTATYTDIIFTQLKPVSVEQSTWGQIKALHR